MSLPFQNKIAEELIKKVDLNAMIHQAISKLDKAQIAKMLVDGFKAEVAHLQAQDPSHPGHTYMDEALERIDKIEAEAAALVEVLKAAHVI